MTDREILLLAFGALQAWKGCPTSILEMIEEHLKKTAPILLVEDDGMIDGMPKMGMGVIRKDPQ